jgi:deazaflavin-dependent oxidoreductase (nitroreductase family)
LDDDGMTISAGQRRRSSAAPQPESQSQSAYPGQRAATGRYAVRPVSLRPASAGSSRLSGPALFWAWFRRVTLAEFVGFAVPATVGAITFDARPALAVPAVLAAGFVEGAILGWGQVSVLRRAIRVDARRWILATATAAVVAYAIGLTPSTVANSVDGWPPAILAAAGLTLGAALLATIGTAQWLVLRRTVGRSARWIPLTAAAWLAGLAVFLAFAMPLWQPGEARLLVIVIGIGGGALMAATTSLITGAGVGRILAGNDLTDGGRRHQRYRLNRWMYRTGRPNRLARVLNRLSAMHFASGYLAPRYCVTLEVRGRRSGQPISFPLVLVDVDDQQYLVAMLGSGTNWVRNVEAAGGRAILKRHGARAVQLVPVPVDERPPILRRFLELAPGARPHINVDRHAPVAEFARVANQVPVYRITQPLRSDREPSI